MKAYEIAKLVGVHQTTISRWMNGSRNISPKAAVALERATGIDRRAWLWPDEFPNPLLQHGECSEHAEAEAHSEVV